MKALSVIPGQAGSAAVQEVDDPEAGERELLVEGVALGICGTDREIAGGQYGWAPDGRDRLILGHESLGRVRAAPEGSDFSAGDLVVGVVRRPDPVPCSECARGRFDMCRNGRYRERGIKELDGYGSQLWTVEEDYAMRLDPRLERVGMLMEPTTIVAKAWERIDRVGGRVYETQEHASWKVLVTGAGPIGLLAALLGVQRGHDVHVLDRIEDGLKPQLVGDLGATYHSGKIEDAVGDREPDVVIEATGVPQLVFDLMGATAAPGVLCLTGVSPKGRRISVDAGEVNRELVLENDMVFGSVNANLDHYRLAAQALADADVDWLERLITRRVGLDEFRDALGDRPEDVKVVLELA